MTKLTSAEVERVYRTALADKLDTAIIVDGVVAKYAFDPERVKAVKPEIDELLSELPDTFDRAMGGGWSFLNACKDRHGNLWTGLHRDMERLICLGIAVGSASWLMKERVADMPGGVPYFEIHPGRQPSKGVA